MTPKQTPNTFFILRHAVVLLWKTTQLVDVFRRFTSRTTFRAWITSARSVLSQMPPAFVASRFIFMGFLCLIAACRLHLPMCHTGNKIRNSIAKACFHTFSDASFHSNRFYDAWSSTISRSHGNNLQLAFLSVDLSMETNRIKFIDFNTSLSEVLPIFEFELRLEAISMSSRSCFIC